MSVHYYYLVRQLAPLEGIANAAFEMRYEIIKCSICTIMISNQHLLMLLK